MKDEQQVKNKLEEGKTMSLKILTILSFDDDYLQILGELVEIETKVCFLYCKP